MREPKSSWLWTGRRLSARGDSPGDNGLTQFSLSRQYQSQSSEVNVNKHQFKSSRSMYRSMMKVLESSWDAQQELRAMQPLMYQCEPAGDLPVSVKVWCNKILAELK